MSRPSATIPAPPVKESGLVDSRSMTSRWRRASSGRTRGFVATVETTAAMWGSRTAAVTSWPSQWTRGSAGSTPTWSGMASTAEATASASLRSMPWRSHHQAAARYMAPVSR